MGNQNCCFPTPFASAMSGFVRVLDGSVRVLSAVAGNGDDDPGFPTPDLIVVASHTNCTTTNNHDRHPNCHRYSSNVAIRKFLHANNKDDNKDENNSSLTLTVVLTLHGNSDLTKTARWLVANRHAITHVLLTTRRTVTTATAVSSQPLWSSQDMTQVFVAIGNLPKLQVLMLHEVGTPTNPIAMRSCMSVFGT